MMDKYTNINNYIVPTYYIDKIMNINVLRLIWTFFFLGGGGADIPAV